MSRQHAHNVEQKANTAAQNTLQLQPRPFNPPQTNELVDSAQHTATESTNSSKLNFHIGQVDVLGGPTEPPSIQPKLTIGQPNDRYEQQADEVAAQVVEKIHSPHINQREIQRTVVPVSGEMLAPFSTIAPLPIMPLQRQGDIPVGDTSDTFESDLNQARHGGQSLGPKIQTQMESAMGADFSRVKIHTGSHADQLSRSIQAKAFTTGQDVFFKQGEYNPSSRQGQELLAHELTHVVQQNGNTVQRSLDNLVQRDDTEEDVGQITRQNAFYSEDEVTDDESLDDILGDDVSNEQEEPQSILNDLLIWLQGKAQRQGTENFFSFISGLPEDQQIASFEEYGIDLYGDLAKAKLKLKNVKLGTNPLKQRFWSGLRNKVTKGQKIDWKKLGKAVRKATGNSALEEALEAAGFGQNQQGDQSPSKESAGVKTTKSDVKDVQQGSKKLGVVAPIPTDLYDTIATLQGSLVSAKDGVIDGWDVAALPAMGLSIVESVASIYRDLSSSETGGDLSNSTQTKVYIEVFTEVTSICDQVAKSLYQFAENGSDLAQTADAFLGVTSIVTGGINLVTGIWGLAEAKTMQNDLQAYQAKFTSLSPENELALFRQKKASGLKVKKSAMQIAKGAAAITAGALLIAGGPAAPIVLAVIGAIGSAYALWQWYEKKKHKREFVDEALKKVHSVSQEDLNGGKRVELLDKMGFSGMTEDERIGAFYQEFMAALGHYMHINAVEAVKAGATIDDDPTLNLLKNVMNLQIDISDPENPEIPAAKNIALRLHKLK
ncbi:MAG: DUF4157 domain-containing protein [Cyanobacteria bacterium P01_D01_bin.156]